MNQPDNDTSGGRNTGSTDLHFEDTVLVPGTTERLWSVISDPEMLVQCVPGADDIERVSERKYTCEITRGISNLNISLSGEVDLVELNEPDWVVASGTAHDPKTHSDFRMLAAMELSAIDEASVKFAYTAEVSFTGGIASLPNTMLRPIFKSDIDTYFENVQQAVEQREPA